MAVKGKIYLFGDGNYRGNPIHGADLANVCVDVLEVLTHNRMANLAFEALSAEPKISRVPLRVDSAFLGLLRFFTSVKTYGPIEFSMEVMTRDMMAPEYETVRSIFTLVLAQVSVRLLVSSQTCVCRWRYPRDFINPIRAESFLKMRYFSFDHPDISASFPIYHYIGLFQPKGNAIFLHLPGHHHFS